MINMIQNAKDQAAALAMSAYKAAVADGTLPEAEVKTAPVEIPKDTANGDFTTTFALAASKALRQPPRNIAQTLLDHMNLEGTYLPSDSSMRRRTAFFSQPQHSVVLFANGTYSERISATFATLSS